MRKKGLFYAVAVVTGFLLAVLLALGGLWLYHANGDFYSALKGRLGGGFYLSALLVVVGSSLLYTPFSYGLSYFFLRRGEGRPADLFYLFRRPLLLAKAVVLSVVKKVAIWLERLVLLLLAALSEVLLFFFFLIIRGENVFGVKGNPFVSAAEFMLGSPWLMGLSVALWSGVLLGLVRIHLRYIFCKYLLMRYPDSGILQALRVGRQAGKVGRLFGFLGAGSGFSAYALHQVEEVWWNYCSQRSRR